MHITALVEPIAGRPGFRASLGPPFDLTAEGPTEEEAVQLLDSALRIKLSGGARIVSIPLPGPTVHPPSGWLPDDEVTQEWLQAVEEYRRQCDVEDRRRILGEASEEKEAS